MKKPLNVLCLPSLGAIDQITKNMNHPINLTKGKFSDIDMIFYKNEAHIFLQGRDISEFAFAWINASWGNKDLAYATSLYLSSKGIPTTYVEQMPSKITDHMVFGLNHITVPQTVFIKKRTIKNKIDLLKRVCGFPLIVKNTRGLGGSDTKLINSEAELIAAIDTLPKNREYIFQQFINNNYDWGILVANGIVVTGAKRYAAQGEYRNNICNGANEVFVDVKDIPENVKKMAINASHALNLDWSRADIVIDEKTAEPFLLEVNRYPGITLNSSEVQCARNFLESQIAHKEDAPTQLFVKNDYAKVNA